jgi:excisionase family DNA binding protein
LLTTAEVARRINKSPGAVAMLLERGKIQGYRHRSRWVIPESAVLTFLKKTS